MNSNQEVSKKETKGRIKDSSLSRTRVFSCPCLLLFSVCLGAGWFIFRGFIAGLTAFRSIQQDKRWPDIKEIKNVSDGSRALHIDFYSGKLNDREISNYCEDIEIKDQHPLENWNEIRSTLPLILRENVSVSGIVPLEQYHYYQVCVATHPNHHHRINISLKCNHDEHHVATPHLSHNADMYISVSDMYPTVDHATWISADQGNDSIVLSTHLEEFMDAPTIPSGNGKILYIGIFGRDSKIDGVRDVTTAGIPYTLQVAISNLEKPAVRSQLRGH